MPDEEDVVFGDDRLDSREMSGDEYEEVDDGSDFLTDSARDVAAGEGFNDTKETQDVD